MSQEQSSTGEKIELHHESIEEIMGTPPASMIRIGSGILLIVILGLLTGSQLITYPDMVQAPALLQGALPLSVQTSSATGRIVHISLYAGNQVHQGDTLLCIENNNRERVVITAATSGIVELNPLVDIKRHVQKNDTVFIIWGEEAGPVACIIHLPPDQGKNIKEGNKLLLHLNKYPSEHYGVVESHVKAISHFNTGRDIQIIAEISSATTTSDQHKILIRGNVYASAEIITGEKTIFNRLVNPFRGLIK